MCGCHSPGTCWITALGSSSPQSTRIVQRKRRPTLKIDSITTVWSKLTQFASVRRLAAFADTGPSRPSPGTRRFDPKQPLADARAKKQDGGPGGRRLVGAAPFLRLVADVSPPSDNNAEPGKSSTEEREACWLRD